MTNTHIIKTDAAYGAVNGWPEAPGRTIELLTLILKHRPRLDGAACVGHDPDMWFQDGRNPLITAEAEAICGSCPVRSECGTYAERVNPRGGIWAGEASYRARERNRAS
ncbi:putative transcription factor [uncultured Caudovirales phage]|uniref:Putative transcription factor n=1 Tax=uncultured Caudovirales phage TaxID=2100421 RepID=A0A2H4JGM8_9CAUD|nr:putative transcription factor [uncultured Caudovirales phage]